MEARDIQKRFGSRLKIATRKTPHALHPYTATVKGRAEYGWGNSPTEARAKLFENLCRSEQDALESGNAAWAASFA